MQKKNAKEQLLRYQENFTGGNRIRHEGATWNRDEAIAEEQQMKAKVAENRSQYVLSEAEVPKVMAEAFKAGRIEAS